MVEHPPLPEGDWYACEFPERPPESEWGAHRTHWLRGCERCWPSFYREATLGKSFSFPNAEPRRNRAWIEDRDDPARLQRWFMKEGEYAVPA